VIASAEKFVGSVKVAIRDDTVALRLSTISLPTLPTVVSADVRASQIACTPAADSAYPVLPMFQSPLPFSADAAMEPATIPPVATEPTEPVTLPPTLPVTLATEPVTLPWTDAAVTCSELSVFG
jgi:hypothetical protein